MFNNAYFGRRILITGHTGFKGAWLSQWLLMLGAELAGFSLYLPSDPSLFEVLSLSEKMTDVRGDIRDLEALIGTLNDWKPEVVFHLAAQPIVLAAYADPKTTFDTNAGGSVNIMEAVRRVGGIKALVMITSDKCYENLECDVGYRETDRLGGKDPYSASKACAEIAISSYYRSYFQGSDTRLVSARAGNVIGGGDWADSRIVPDAMRAWSENRDLLLRFPGATRPWQHVLEPLSGYLRIGAELLNGNKAIEGQSFNFGPSNDTSYTVGELITAMAARWQGEAAVFLNHDTPQASEAGLLTLCCDKALSALLWQANLDFTLLVEMITDWYQAYYAGEQDMETLTRAQINAYVKIAKKNKQPWVVSK